MNNKFELSRITKALLLASGMGMALAAEMVGSKTASD